MPPTATRRQVLAGVAATCGTILPSASTRGATNPPISDSQSESTSFQSDDLAAVVRQTLERSLREYDANGATVAVVENGETVLTEGFGHAYLNPDVPVESETTLFRIGSVSKVFPFVAAMGLIDAGRIDPHAPVREALESVSIPDATAYEEPITLAHLATHTAGFEERSGGQFRHSPDKLRSLSDALQANDPKRIQPPGKLPLYTNYNAGLAGQLVADALGTDFETAIQQFVFEPLGMTASTFDPLPAPLVGGRSDAAEEITWYSEMTPASGMSATADDMARFLRAVVGDGSVDGGRILSPDAVDELHRQWYTPHEELAGAAFGLERQRRDGRLIVGHQGGVPDFQTDFRLVPEEGVGLFVSAHGTEANDVQQAVTKAFLEHVAPVPEPTRTPAEAPTRGDELTGTYRSVLVTDAASFEKPLLLQKADITVRIGDSGELVTERRGTTDRWVEVAPLVFRRSDGANTLVFKESDDGAFHVFRASAPRNTFESVPWHGQVDVHSPLGLSAGVIALSGAVGWPLAATWRRFRGQSGVPKTLTRARWTAGGSMFAFLAFFVLSVIGITEYWLYARPPWFDVLFWLPIVGGLLTLGAAGFVVQAWRRGQGSLLARIHATAIVVGLAVLSGILWYWNILQLSLG